MVTTATEATEVSVEIDEAVAPEVTTEAATEEAAPETTEPPVTVYETDENVLLDNDDCTFSMGQASNNELAGMQVEVTCVNKTEEALDFTWNDVSVCGLMYDPSWAVTVAAGETLTSQVEIDTYVLETMDIHSPDEITFTLTVVSSENWMDEPKAEETFTIYPTGLSADTVVYPVRESIVSEEVVVDDDNLTFIIEYVEQQDLSYVVRCYIANKTRETIMVSWENVQLNGQAMDPFWATYIAPGKCAYAQVNFSADELAGLGIGSVEEITFDLMAYRYSDWMELVNTSVVYVPVEEAALG